MEIDIGIDTKIKTLSVQDTQYIEIPKGWTMTRNQDGDYIADNGKNRIQFNSTGMYIHLDYPLRFEFDLPRLPFVNTRSKIRIPQILGKGQSTIDGNGIAEVTYEILDVYNHRSERIESGFKVRYANIGDIIHTKIVRYGVPFHECLPNVLGNNIREKLDNIPDHTDIVKYCQYISYKFIISWLLVGKFTFELCTSDKHDIFMKKLANSRFGQYVEVFEDELYDLERYSKI